jgi:hypothetical protein
MQVLIIQSFSFIKPDASLFIAMSPEADIALPDLKLRNVTLRN